MVRDPHSYAQPDLVRIRHIDLELDIDFERRILSGSATLHFPNGATELVLDTRALDVQAAETAAESGTFREVCFTIGPDDPVLGAPLSIPLNGSDRMVRVRYATRPEASGLQWLEPAQTAGKRTPFLYTQSQAIHARSWFPTQDTPGVRVTYSARVRLPRMLQAVMSAEMDHGNGEHRFRMPQAVPSYLIALAAGDLAFAPLGERSGVYAEPAALQSAAREFEDTEAMMAAVEELYGPYRWGRYDLLVLPPSFPFGGMENPRLTFATPTVLAGDKSLVSLVAHELAHSWSGNLVTNATWEHFWLNEGFTVYLERRIIERIFGTDRAAMEAALARYELEQEMAQLDERDRVLRTDLAGRDPDCGFTLVPYEKGALFLMQLEQVFGRERFDRFLRAYFDRFAFQSISTAQFLDYLQAELFSADAARAAQVPVDEWLDSPGIPTCAPRVHTDAFRRVKSLARRWVQGEIQTAALPAPQWTTQEWLHFLRSLPKALGADRMASLDQCFGLTGTGNSEIAAQWLLMSIRNAYEPAEGRLDRFLTSVGRRKFLKPLYKELVKTSEGLARARQIYACARAGYHPIARATLDPILQ